MKISRLLELDTNQNKSSLNDSFGDSYLLQNNLIFSNIRKATLNIGYSYSSDQNVNYLALPLSQLSEILKEKIIPYFNNKKVLLNIEQKAPAEINWADIEDQYKKNYVFHESCHAVARHLTDLYLNFKTNEHMILKNYLEESFANTCELLALAESSDPAHRIFLECNSYCGLFEERTHIKNAIKSIGFNVVFKFIFLSYLHANFLKPHLVDKDLSHVLNFIQQKINESDLKTLKALSKHCFKMNPQFRQVTSLFYLKIHNLKIDHAHLAQLDFMSLLNNNPSCTQLIHSLSQTAYLD